MNDDKDKILILMGLQDQFHSVVELAKLLVKGIVNLTIQEYDEQVLSIMKAYKVAKNNLIRLGFSEIYSSLPNPPIESKIGYMDRDKALGILYQLITGGRAGYAAIKTILYRQTIPEELGFREELETIENIDPDIYKNLDRAFLEAEHGHYLASGLISARVVDYIVSKFKGKNIDEKIDYLKSSGLIDKERKDEIREFTFTAKKLVILFLTTSKFILLPMTP
ncbi:hypothetical protein DRP05_05715 [Archaeoglobales archaeon]|nr:MAG: hypothetical protein DRP05_05715 [Archaeoglobales archaeon]